MHYLLTATHAPPLAQRTSYLDGPFRGLVSYFRLETLPFYNAAAVYGFRRVIFQKGERGPGSEWDGSEGVQMDGREGNHRINLGWREKWVREIGL